MTTLLQPADLVSRLSSPRPPVVLDLRTVGFACPARAAYEADHIPGAVFADLEADLSGPVREDRVGGRHPLPPPECAQAALRRLGVRNDTGAVCYDGGDGLGSSRGWWLLRYLGHRDVSVLDGGLPAWQEAGLATESGHGRPEAQGDFIAKPGALPVIDASEAVKMAREGLLLDVRAAERYRGAVEPIDPVAGHIPGAVSAPSTANVDDRSRFLPVDQLVNRFRALGAAPDRAVAAYCGSGITASQTVLALELAGITAALYPGSWSDWVSDPTRPVATGAD